MRVRLRCCPSSRKSARRDRGIADPGWIVLFHRVFHSGSSWFKVSQRCVVTVFKSGSPLSALRVFDPLRAATIGYD